MLDFSFINIIRRLVLLITAVLIGYICLTVKVYRGLSLDYAANAVFRCIGIAIIGGMLFYILAGKKQSKD